MYRMLCFFKSGIHHENVIIANFFKNSLLSNSSYAVRNVNIILRHLDLDYNYVFTENKKEELKAIFHNNMSKSDWRISMLKELLDINDNLLLSDLNQEEVRTLIDHISRSRLYP